MQVSVFNGVLTRESSDLPSILVCQKGGTKELAQLNEENVLLLALTSEWVF